MLRSLLSIRASDFFGHGRTAEQPGVWSGRSLANVAQLHGCCTGMRAWVRAFPVTHGHVPASPNLPALYCRPYLTQALAASGYGAPSTLPAWDPRPACPGC